MPLQFSKFKLCYLTRIVHQAFQPLPVGLQLVQGQAHAVGPSQSLPLLSPTKPGGRQNLLLLPSEHYYLPNFLQLPMVCDSSCCPVPLGFTLQADCAAWDCGWIDLRACSITPSHSPGISLSVLWHMAALLPPLASLVHYKIPCVPSV